MSTNWPDVAALIVSGVILCSALGIGTWLAVAGHHWFALLVFVIVGCMRITTGGQP